VYSNGESEVVLGEALRKFGARRESQVIATKLFSPVSDDVAQITFQMKPQERQQKFVNRYGLSRKHVFDACEASLKRLQVDYIDLYQVRAVQCSIFAYVIRVAWLQIHRWDYDTPIQETMEALNDLVRSGKVRYIGASSMFAWQFAKAQAVAEKNGWAKFVSMQVNVFPRSHICIQLQCCAVQNFYNLLYREEEREMNPMCKDMVSWYYCASHLLWKASCQYRVWH
jgi:aryl-alcohol dehydrogenase-like predicted oxidoreductase